MITVRTTRKKKVNNMITKKELIETLELLGSDSKNKNYNEALEKCLKGLTFLEPTISEVRDKCKNSNGCCDECDSLCDLVCGKDSYFEPQNWDIEEITKIVRGEK